MVFQVSTFLSLGFILFLYLQTPVLAKDQLIYCAVNTGKTRHLVTGECLLLIETNDPDVRCNMQPDRVSCLQLLLNGTVDFMIAEPEDLIVIGMNEEYSGKIQVSQELLAIKNASASHEMVVIVDRSIENLRDTEKSLLCLPDLHPAALYDMKYFEKQLLVPECDPKRALLENRISALSNYFEKACIPGPWTSDDNIDAKLKMEYKNLCQACKKNNGNCSSEDEYYGREGSLKCLTDKRGNITWAKLEDVLEHFRVTKLDKEEYRFFCPDGKIRSMNDNPCIWLSKPWRTVITKQDYGMIVHRFIFTGLIQTHTRFSYLLEEDEENDLYTLPSLVYPFKTATEYLEMFPEWYSLRDHVQCKPDHKVKWCVSTNIEYRKCKWLSDAAKTQGVEPLIECVQESSVEDCLTSLKYCNSDIFVSRSQSEFESERKDFKPIVSMMSSTKHSDIVGWVKKSSKNFNSFEDLKGHKACFSAYRNAAWNKFIYQMKHSTQDNDWYCKDAEMVSKYFYSTCVVHVDEGIRPLPELLYSLCIGMKQELHTDDHGVQDKLVLNCLDQLGDVAFINLDDHPSSYIGNLLKYYNTIRFNELIFESDLKESYSLNLLTLGSVLVKGDILKAREDEITLMLLELNELFGIEFKSSTPQISMFGTFEGKRDVIFHSNTTYLERYSDQVHRIPDYVDIVEDILHHRKTCYNPN